MKVKYLGPRESINVHPYGPHAKDEVKNYPDDFAHDLVDGSSRQQFEAVGGKTDEKPGDKGGKDEKPAGNKK